MEIIVSSCCMMLFCLIATVGVFAGTVTVSDTESFAVDMDNYAVVTLSGLRDTSTDRLSNVKTDKKITGSIVVSFDPISRPSQYRANCTAHFRYQGLYKGYRDLSI